MLGPHRQQLGAEVNTKIQSYNKRNFTLAMPFSTRTNINVHTVLHVVLSCVLLTHSIFIVKLEENLDQPAVILSSKLQTWESLAVHCHPLSEKNDL